MSTTDPVTGEPLPADAIQRVLFVAPRVHIYQIPPILSNKGFQASSWTENNNQRLIFTARLRVIETALPKPPSNPAATEEEEEIRTTVLLEDGSSGELFAAAPYAHPAAVQQASDSSRFFAVRVEGAGGKKATLGLGFEERSDAFDFGVALQDARRVLGIEESGSDSSLRASAQRTSRTQQLNDEKKDYRLKEGETIRVALGGKGQRGAGAGAETRVGEGKTATSVDLSSFSIKPPLASGDSGGGVGGGAMPFLPPPPSASDVKAQQRGRRGTSPGQKTAADDSGFGDDDFGEFTG